MVEPAPFICESNHLPCSFRCRCRRMASSALSSSAFDRRTDTRRQGSDDDRPGTRTIVRPTVQILKRIERRVSVLPRTRADDSADPLATTTSDVALSFAVLRPRYELSRRFWLQATLIVSRTSPSRGTDARRPHSAATAVRRAPRAVGWSDRFRTVLLRAVATPSACHSGATVRAACRRGIHASVSGPASKMPLGDGVACATRPWSAVGRRPPRPAGCRPTGRPPGCCDRPAALRGRPSTSRGRPDRRPADA